VKQNPPPNVRIRLLRVTGMRVMRRDWLGGLFHEYAQVA
jgi:hypothetical protein